MKVAVREVYKLISFFFQKKRLNREASFIFQSFFSNPMSGASVSRSVDKMDILEKTRWRFQLHAIH